MCNAYVLVPHVPPSLSLYSWPIIQLIVVRSVEGTSWEILMINSKAGLSEASVWVLPAYAAVFSVGLAV